MHTNIQYTYMFDGCAADAAPLLRHTDQYFARVCVCACCFFLSLVFLYGTPHFADAAVGALYMSRGARFANARAWMAKYAPAPGMGPESFVWSSTINMHRESDHSVSPESAISCIINLHEIRAYGKRK